MKCDHVMKVMRTRKQPPHENKQERAALFRTSEQVLSLLVFFYAGLCERFPMDTDSMNGRKSIFKKEEYHKSVGLECFEEQPMYGCFSQRIQL